MKYRILTIAEQRQRAAERHAKRIAAPASEPAPPPLDLTPEGIANMPKADVVELLQAHGATVDGRKGVATLRDELTAIMFIKGDDANE